MTNQRYRAAVLGSPIAHSRSPLLHRECYRILGRPDCIYEAFEVKSGQLSTFWETLDQTWMGLSLTMPLKVEVLPFLAATDEWAQAVGAVNTVIFTDDGPMGFNTDVLGFIEVLRPRLAPGISKVTILGAGATARSAAVALAHLGVTNISVMARRRDAVAEIATCTPSMNVEFIEWPDSGTPAIDAELVISTLPADVPTLMTARPGQWLLDVSYPDPERLVRWRATGGEGVDGRTLLVQQGVAQALLFTGYVANAQTLSELVTAATRAVA